MIKEKYFHRSDYTYLSGRVRKEMMKLHGARSLAALCIAMLSEPGFAELPDDVITLSHPQVAWVLQFTLPNALEQYGAYKEGAGSYAFGQTRNEDIRYSLAIDKFDGAKDATSCRDGEAIGIRNNPDLRGLKLETSEAGEIAELRVSGSMKTDKGNVFTQNLHRYMYRDGLCAKLHVSTLSNTPTAVEELTKVASSMRISTPSGDLTRMFYVPQAGSIVLSMPRSWSFETSNPSNSRQRAITIYTSDEQFHFVITAVKPRVQTQPDDVATYEAAESARKQTGTIALQREIKVEELKGRNAKGHYVFVSDKTLAGKPNLPKTWKHMRQGMLKTGDVFATFSVFSNETDAPDALSAMRSLEGLSFRAE